MKPTIIAKAIDHIAKQLQALLKQYDRLIYVGRFAPLHLGHQAVMGGIIQAAPENHMVMIGSCNADMSIRHLFSYLDRRDFINTVFPKARVLPIPDFIGDDPSWFRALDDIIECSGSTPEKTIFIGGCEEDVSWYFSQNRKVHIVNRFSGQTLNVSGTEVRDNLIAKNRKRLARLLDPRIIDLVQKRFDARWSELRRR